MKRAEVLHFEKILAKAQGLQEEFLSMAKKKPDAPVSKFKLKFLNSTISELNDVLGHDNRPYDDFENFDEDDLPTVSDVTLMLGQYLECAENMRANNIGQHIGLWYWRIDGDAEDQPRIRTAEPKKIRTR